MTHPRIYRQISDDGSPPPEEFQPSDHPAVTYLMAYQGEELLGLYVLVPHNSVCWEAHVAMLPRAWGRARAATRALFAWLWTHTPCRRLVASIPESNRLALALARETGMRVFGFNEKSFLRGGRLEGQILLGLSRPDEE
jgi:RimJ/RimL family protein N-acetyltransferase